MVKVCLGALGASSVSWSLCDRYIIGWFCLQFCTHVRSPSLTDINLTGDRRLSARVSCHHLVDFQDRLSAQERGPSIV